MNQEEQNREVSQDTIFREQLTQEYLKKHKIERCQNYGIQIAYFVCFLLFGVAMIMCIEGKKVKIFGQTKKNVAFYINQMVYFIVLIVQQRIRYRLIRRNYDFFESRKPKILIMIFTIFFFMQNLVMLFFLFANIAYSQLKDSSNYKQIADYITISNLVIPCIVILLIEVILGFTNHILFTFVLRRRMRNNLVNRILAQSEIRPNEYLALQQHITSLNSWTQYSSSINFSTDDTQLERQISGTKIKDDLARNLIKSKDFVCYGTQGDIKEEEQEYTCSICYVQINMEDKAIYLECKHLYHSDCLRLWLKNHHTCPFCRTIV